MDHQQQYILMKAQLAAHCGGFTSSRPQGWAPQRQLTDPNTMDTFIGRTRGRIMGSEEMNPHNATWRICTTRRLPPRRRMRR